MCLLVSGAFSTVVRIYLAKKKKKSLKKAKVRKHCYAEKESKQNTCEQKIFSISSRNNTKIKLEIKIKYKKMQNCYADKDTLKRTNLSYSGAKSEQGGLKTKF